MALKTVDDLKVSGDMAQWLRKHDEAQAKLQMHNMGQNGGEAVALNSENDVVRLPRPNVFTMEWSNFEPSEEERQPGGFNMSMERCMECAEVDQIGSAEMLAAINALFVKGTKCKAFDFWKSNTQEGRRLRSEAEL